MARLEVTRDGDAVLSVVVDGSGLVVGGGPGCDLELPGEGIAERALRVIPAGVGYLLERWDEGGPASVLGDGDSFVLGGYRLVFRGGAEEPASSAGDDLARRTRGLLSFDRDSGRLEKVVGVLLDPALEGDAAVLARLDGQRFVLGASEDCDLVIDEPTISGLHCELYGKHGAFWVRDLDSTNGTRVGGQRVGEAELPYGSELELGGQLLRLEREEVAADGPVAPAEGRCLYAGMLTSDPAMKELFELIERAADSPEAVLVVGETGTGKELVARALHDRSSRRNGPFVALNCGALARELIESELFGHERGAFTGAVSRRLGAFGEADGGTLFLDELGELPLDLQPRLLRVLETGEVRRLGAQSTSRVDVRVVAATHRQLAEQAAEGEFREDLYYRFVLPLALPALRERPGDVGLLAEHFLTRLSAGRETPALAPGARERLETYPWPGNVRELRAVMARALLLGPKQGDLAADHLRFQPAVARDAGPEWDAEFLGRQAPLHSAEIRPLRVVECEAIEAALQSYDNNRRETARALGISRSTLHRKMQEYEIEVD